MKSASERIVFAAGNWSHGCRRIFLRWQLHRLSAKRFEAAMTYRDAIQRRLDAEVSGAIQSDEDIAPFEKVADAALRVLQRLLDQEAALASELAKPVTGRVDAIRNEIGS